MINPASCLSRFLPPRQKTWTFARPYSKESFVKVRNGGEVSMEHSTAEFKILEATIDDIHSAYKSGNLTCRQLVQMYLDRIEAFDKKGPAINAIITISSTASTRRR